jgi:4-alpha-glucanotransferase
MSDRPALHALAERAGIHAGYDSALTKQWTPTSDATRVALLAALGIDASDEAAARRALEAWPPATVRAPEPPTSAPARCVDVRERLGDRRAAGLWANLYTLRSARGLGFGDATDLRELLLLCARTGADFVGVNPLHASRNHGYEVSPYAPLSRIFRNALYLDVFAVPELAESPDARRRLEASEREIAALRQAPRIDYERCAALQRELLAPLHASFRALHGGGRTARGEAYARFAAGEDLLLDFATFCALDDALARPGHARDFRAWPAPLREPGGEAVRAFRAAHADEVDLHAWIQFELDRQLAAAAAAGRSAGLAIGLYTDLAIGSAASGFDPWAFPDLFRPEVTVGAPPDDFNPQGQDWGFPALDPRRLAAEADGYFARVLRRAFDHAGALRIDHVMGLFRQWWIPAGAAPTEGAYVDFPSYALLDRLAEESRRAGALVIGEDLGTVPPGLPERLAERGILSSRVFLFEREWNGEFRPPEHYPDRALVTAVTHDTPTLAGFLAGRDLELRRSLGLFPDEAAYQQARAAREAERGAALRRLAAEGLLPSAESPPDPDAFRDAVHRLLARTPAPLVAYSLDDLAGEVEPVNLPGVGPERFSSWTRRMSRTPEEVLAGVRLGRES